MKCERCQKNPATQVIRGEKNGQPCELFVCDECARPPVKAAGAMSLADILFSLGMPQAGQAPSPSSPGTAAAAGAPPSTRAPVLCPACGLSRESLREHRRFGCPACYDAFEDDVKSFLRELQYADSHVGRKPGKTARHESLAALEARLAEAIRREDFTRAAELRDALIRQRPPQPPSGNSDDGET